MQFYLPIRSPYSWEKKEIIENTGTQMPTAFQGLIRRFHAAQGNNDLEDR